MAGIGFELKKVLKQGTLTSVLKTFGYSAALSSGPWVISMVIILAVGLTSVYYLKSAGTDLTRLQGSVTYVIALASSLVFTGFLQLPFTRYTADRIFENKHDLVLPNYFGTLVVTIVTGFIFIFPSAYYIFDTQTNTFIILFVGLFLVLCLVWLSNILAASLKLYKIVIASYFFGYSLIYVFSIVFKDEGVEGLLKSFFIGNTVLFILLFIAIIYHYPSKYLVRFDMFLNKREFYWKLGWSGLFYNFAIWVDKIIFWYHPLTGYQVIDKLNASLVYDLPIFLAYLSIIPGMAIFFYRLEADFAEHYDNFYTALRTNGTLKQIWQYQLDMIRTVKIAIREILFLQGIFSILIFINAEWIFDALKIPKLYIPLFYVDVIGTQLQLGFMSILAFFYYLDRQDDAVYFTLAFVLLNAIFAWLSIYMGPFYFGYGFALALLILFIISIYKLSKTLEELDYDTFMLQ